MKWLEIIKVQGAKTGYQNADTDLLEQLAHSTTSNGLENAQVYAHASVADDLVITLKWDTDPPDATGSTMALNIIREFKRHGLVDHSVWIERLPLQR